MKTIEKLPKLAHFCALEQLRPVMNCILIDGEYGIASDAHILVRARVSQCFLNPELMNGKLIHRSVWHQMSTASLRKCTETGIVCSYENYSCEYRYTNPRQNYPDWTAILSKKAIEAADKSEPVKEIALSPNVIAKLQHITSLPIRFKLNKQQIGYVMANEDFIGLIMPCALEMVEDHFYGHNLPAGPKTTK